jgi:hypothetical protein
MGCVNKTSKEFKDLAAKHNVSHNKLELIVHKYWLESGNETLFPSDVYIQAQLGNKAYEEHGKSVRKLWELRYNTPMEFSNMKEVQRAVMEASKYFPQSAIHYYRNANDHFTFTVEKPVEKVDSKDDFFDSYDGNGSLKNVKTLKLGIEENKTYGIDKVQELYNRFNTNKTSKALADRAFNIAKELGLQITFDESLPFGTMGRYTSKENSLRFKKSFLERDMMNSKKAPIMLHEVLHALSMYALSNQTKNWKRGEALESFRTEMNSLYQDLKNNSLLKGERGIVDLYEFVAELANPIFRDKIKNIDRDAAAEKKIEKKSFWSRIVDAFKKLLGLHTTNTYYQRSMNALDKALDAFDIDTYMRYNGIKNLLRQGYNAKDWEFNSMSDAEVKSNVSNYFDKKVYNAELQSLKEKAIADGTFMKAPNGKDTKLTERQWLQVRTKAFKDWFGDWENNPKEASKVVDENGEPLVVYHGGAQNIRVFHHSSEKESNTGYGFYTDPKTGEKIPLDSNNAIFFSSNPFVGTSYATMYGIQYFQHMYSQIEDTLFNSTKEEGLHFTRDHFEHGINDFYEFLTNAAEINPRFQALKNYIQRLKQEGKTITKENEREEILKMLRELRSRIQDFTSEYLMNRSEWGNVYSRAKEVINTYNNPDGIEKLLKGEIPETLQREWEIYKKIQSQRKKEGLDETANYEEVHLTLGKNRYYLIYDGKDLSIWNPEYTDPKVTDMTREELSKFLSEAKQSNQVGIEDLKNDTAYQTVKGKAQEYSVFLNVRNPLTHDYEGTHQGQGYKQSKKYPFGYVAARQVNKAIKEGNDGVVYKNLYDPYLANNYGVFDSYQIKSATDNTGEFSTTNPEIQNYELAKEVTDSMSGEQLKDELSLIKQESTDYDMLNGIEEKPKSSGKAIPQDFTFADGIKVQAPFRPNAQQVDALNEMDRFMKSDETSMTLSGYAGTGKTSLMEMIAKKGQKQYRPVQFCASTNKAAAVLNDRVSKAGFKATTLNKLFGINVEVDENSSHYNARNLVTALRDVDIAPGTTVVIDEASMINEENYNILNSIAKRLGLKIIYVGDEAQLAPVNETQISKVFRNGDGKVIRLTQVERTADNAILKEATDLRNGKVLSGESSFNSKGEGVAYISPSHQDAIDEVIESYSKDLKKDSNHFRILAYTNKAVAAYNNQVRGLLGYKTPIPQVGEPMMGYAQWGYDWRSKSYRLINSESYKVTRVDKPRTVSINTQDGKTLTMIANPITMVDSTGKEDTFNYIDVKSNPQNREIAKVLANEKQILWGLWKRAVGRDAKAKVLQRINVIDEFLFINDNLEGEPNSKGIRPLLAKKVIDFGYAMTVHKSQGSTFTNVLLDDVDIARGTRGNSIGNFENFNMVNLGEDMGADLTGTTFNDNSSEEVDFGDLSDVETSTPSEESIANPTTPQTVNIRQQLEYVGVSRATDTVTVISNNVKKEGSPLYPEKAIKEDNSRYNNKNQDNGKEEYKSTDEFRRVQEGSRKFTEKGLSPFNQGVRELDDISRGRIGGVLERLLDSQRDDSRFSVRTTLTHENKNGKTGSFTLGEVSPKLFHDIFEVTRVYLHNGELVDLHDDYSNCKCFVTSDGLCGFAIEPDGNLVSVFSLSPSTNKGFLYAIKDFLRQEGATHLDAYASSNQPLQKIYAKTLGFHTASTMDYNMEYDHDDIAKNHGNPQVVFMVNHEVAEPKHFDKDSYDEAQQYQLDQLKATKEEASFEVKDNTQNNTKVENLSEKKEETQQVSLPGYEYYKELYDETPVDAEWKVSYLKELDAQLSLENSEEENQNIINQMDNVLQATSEKEYLQDSKEDKKKQAVQRALSEHDKIVQQLNDLLDNKDLQELGCSLSAQEIRHVAEQIANELSDLITQLQEEKGLAQTQYGREFELDFQTASRKDIVRAIGITNMIRRAKQIFSPEVTDYDDIDTIAQAHVIGKNWDAMMYLASDIFAMNEGFGITKDYTKHDSYVTTEGAKIDHDNFNDYSNDPDAAAETGEKDEQEHWQVEQRTIDVLNSMSALVRQGLHECFVLDKDGNKVYSKWQIAERVNPRATVNSILRWTQGSTSLEDMVTKLSQKQSSNPWLSQLISRLSDKSGKETDFQSQFYGVFSKHYQLYSIVLMEDGKYESIPVNSHPALSEAIKGITAQFRIGEHPLFTEKSINSKYLGSKETTSDKSEFNLFKALKELTEVDATTQTTKTLDEAMTEKVISNVIGVSKMLGYPATEEMLADVVNIGNVHAWVDNLRHITDDLSKASKALQEGKIKSYDPFKYYGDYNISNALRNFLAPVMEKMEDTAVNAFYDSGKMYQSYITPSFMTKLMNKFKYLDGAEFEKFIIKEYGSSEWFKYQDHGNPMSRGWRNRWLHLLANDPEARKAFDHKVELNFNKHNYMRNMSDQEYALSLIMEFFAEDASYNGKGKTMPTSWYRIPMMSNKPSSEFIKFYSYRGDSYKKNVARDMFDIFLQELSRIQTVRMRNLSKNSPEFIKNFDSNGKKFNFLPVFNSYLENTDSAKAKRTLLHNEDGTVSADNNKFAELLQRKLEGTELTKDEKAIFNNLADAIIRQSLEDRVQSILDKWEKRGILEAAEKISGIYPSEFNDEKQMGSKENMQNAIKEHVRKQVEMYLWNDTLASKNILLLTIGDIAFYKDAEDLQKRLSQLHAPGIRGRKEATDYEGNRVSDGKYRTVILKDFDDFKSNLIANITEVFDKRITRAETAEQKKRLEVLKDSLVRPRTYNADGSVKDKGGKYWNINVADAQGFSSPSSYRKKALIFGKWSRHAEDIYQKLLKGEYNYTDLEVAFQPLKPFVYSKLTKNLGVENAPIHSMQVPFQAKNAEYLLFMADAILKGEELSRPNLLRAIYRVMEDSEKFCPTKGIDTVQFESAIKSGLQGKLDIAQFREEEGGEEAAYAYMMNQVFKPEVDDNTGDRIYREYNTDVFVHETSYDDYCLQQEVPEHFKNHSQAHGSQTRMIIPSDLDLFTTDENGNQVDNFYEWDEPDGTHKKVSATEYKKEYENTIKENIEESIDVLAAELHLNSDDKKERNLALSRILQNEIISSPRYGIDLVQACSIDKETGEFRIPKGDPIQAKRIEQLINSIIKNRINKQKIAGGPIVQVSNFGTSQQLHIRFKDKSQENGIIPLEKDYVPSEHNGLSYKEYIKKNQGGIAYFEVYAPIWSNELFDKFANEDGSINVEAINAVDPELLKMVSYRIPTEDKYSCAPMKVVGFMPREAGDAIMLPYELTEIDDSDFDVDKRYVMRKDISIVEKNYDDYVDELEERGKKLYKEIFGNESSQGYVERMVSSLAKNPKAFHRDSPFRKALFNEYQKLAFKTVAPTSGRTYRDNKIIDMTYAVLTNEMTADKILNPGGFDAPKKMGYMVAAYKNANNKLSWQELQGKSIDELKDLSYTDKDLTFADTQVQFYKQNSAAASLIGVFAVNKVAHATLEGDSIYLDVAQFCGKKPFVIAGTTFDGRMQIDGMYDQEGNLIGKTLGSLVSASADAVKDPILNLMNVNMTTAGMLNTMLRLGMPFNDAALFLSQDIIERTLNEFNRKNLSNYEPLDNIINKWLEKYREKYDIDENSNINNEALTREELVEGLKSDKHEAIDYKVLLAFQKMRSLTDAMRKPTFATRFNSISSAVGPLIVDNLILEHKMESFLAGEESSTGFYTSADITDDTQVDINSIFENHPILQQFARTVGIARGMFYDMPAGSEGFRKLLRNLPSDISDKMFRDKKLLDSFSTFYQSYLLIKSGVINPANLGNYVNGFPEWFMKQDFKKKYSDNALIQAIKMNVSKKTGKPFLSINITGMDEQQKEELRSAWTDLHRANTDLSKKLFDYCFFRAGIGFSPKTFMALVPTYVKEHLASKDGQSSYVDTYRKFPNTDYLKNTIIDQFIRNNWDNNKLVPIRGEEGTNYNVNLAKGTLKVYRDADKVDVQDLSYMKTKVGKDWYLWKRKEGKSEDIEFERVKPLGNNGEYLEISLTDIEKPLEETTKKETPVQQPNVKDDATVEDTNTSDLKVDSPMESDAQESSKPQVSDAGKIEEINEITDLLIKQNPKFDKESAEKKFEEIKKSPKVFAGFLQNVFKHKGLDLDRTQAVDEFKKYC